MIKISNIKLKIDFTNKEIESKICKTLRCNIRDIEEINIIKKSKDVRNKKNIHFIFTLAIKIKDEKKYLKIKNVTKLSIDTYKVEKVKSEKKPVIIGSGPAGLFCALILAKSGLNPIIIERGSNVDDRVKEVENFLKNKVLNINSNVQFGEGGAGTFSDGKLTTGISDKRISEVLNELVLAGAPKEIIYESKPHIGTDLLIKIVKNIRKKIIDLGGEVRFNNIFFDFTIKNGKITNIHIKENDKNYTIETDDVVLSIGHSARDTFELLNNKNISMESKPFSVGVRIEHKQEFINKVQYGDAHLSKKLGQAEYKLNKHLSNGVGVYTFCMCPGGKVIASQNEEDSIVVNGMSNYKRDSENANSAILVSVNKDDFKRELGTDTDSPLNGMYFQRQMEKSAFILGGSNYKAPCQLVEDFIEGKKSDKLKEVIPSYDLGIELTDLSECLPEFVTKALKEGLIGMDKKIKGFIKNGSVLTGVETRSSSPIKIHRDKNYNSNIIGLMPCGEGAGFAGGIMSASVDGIKCAEQIINKYR